MRVQETLCDTIHWLSANVFIKVRLAPGRHVPAPPANSQGSRPSADLLPQPLPAIPTPENWFPWLPLCAALRIYGGGWESYIKSCLLSSTYYLMLETEMLDGPPYRLPVFPPQGAFICPESSF